MAYKVRINNETYNLKDSFTIKEELNETLDSATIQFALYDGELKAVPFDNVCVFDDEERIKRRYMQVDSYNDEIYSFNNEFDKDDHEYTLTLFSETKSIERITLPNCSVTQSMITGAKQKSVYDEIKRFYELYVPMIRVYDTTSKDKWSFKKKYVLDPKIKEKFDSVVCPELQWNNPTLREVFDDLMSTKDCLVVVKQGIISYYDINVKGKEIDKSKISRSLKTMTSADYVGELTIDIKNSIGKNKTICCEYVSLKASGNSGTLTTDNGVICTQHPIYQIKKLICYAFDTYDSGLKHHLHKIDVTSRIKEEEDWNLLSSVRIGAVGSTYWDLPKFKDDNGYELPMHRVNFLYFKRGEREILNIGTRYQTTQSSTQYFANMVIAGTCVHLGTIDLVTDLGSSPSSPIDPREIFFYIEYEPIVERSMHVGKYLPSEHPNNRIFDNQENSYVDIEHQSIYEYAKVNRLGNKIRTIYGEFESETDIPELGDFIGDEILFSREMTYYDHQIYFKGLLTPRYILKDFFTGVLAKKRSWQIAKSKDALTRHEIYKLFIEASFDKKNEYYGEISTDVCNGIINYSPSTPYVDVITMFVTLGEWIPADRNAKWALSVTKDLKGNFYPSETEGIILDTDIGVQGMSLCFNIGFDDNYMSANYIRKIDDDYQQNFYSYCDENGEFETHDVSIIGTIFGIGDGVTDLPRPLEEDGIRNKDYLSTSERNAIRDLTFIKPKINIQAAKKWNFGLDLVLNGKKDNREIIQNSFQVEYCSDNKRIVINKRLIEMSRMYNVEEVNKNDFRVYLSNQDTYHTYDDYGKGNIIQNYTIKSTVLDQNSIRLQIVDAETGQQIINNSPNLKSWCLTDANNHILFAVNAKDNPVGEELGLYFNILRIRDNKIYANYYGDQVVGDITDKSLAELSKRYANRDIKLELEYKIVDILGQKIDRDDFKI